MKWRTRTKPQVEVEPKRRHDAAGSQAGVFRPLGDFASPPPPPRVTTVDHVETVLPPPAKVGPPPPKRNSSASEGKRPSGSSKEAFRPLGDFAPPPPSRISAEGSDGGKGTKFSVNGRSHLGGGVEPKTDVFRPLGDFVPPPPSLTTSEVPKSPSRSEGTKKVPPPPPPPRDPSPVKTKTPKDRGLTNSVTDRSDNTVTSPQEDGSPLPPFKDKARAQPASGPREIDNSLKISLPEPPPPATFETVQIVVNPKVSASGPVPAAPLADPAVTPTPAGVLSTMATFRADGRVYTDVLEPRDRDEEIYENSPAFRLVPVTSEHGPGARLHSSHTGPTTIQLNGDLVSRVEVSSGDVHRRLTTTVVVTGEPNSRLNQKDSGKVVTSVPDARLNGSVIVIPSANDVSNSTVHVRGERDARLRVSNSNAPVARVSPMTDERLRLTPDSSLSASPLSRSSSHCTERSTGTGSTYNLPLPTTPLGSTDKLIHNVHAQVPPPNNYKASSSWMSSCGQVVTVLSMAVGFGNVFRLPRAVYMNGGGVFLFAYVVLTLVLGLPLVFLEMGLGQFCEEGVTKLYRAVPLFRGVGYVKVLSSVLLAIYYPILMALSLFYMIWAAKGPMPFAECNHTFIGEVVYHHTILGEECLKNTFLRPPKDDGMWFGVNVALMFFIWAFIMLCLFKHGSSLRIATYILSVPAVMCLVALVSESIVQDPNAVGLKRLLKIDWEKLLDIKVWYFAVIQMFFSTHLGFGNIVTSAGRLYPQSNAFWTAAVYIACNLLFGLLSVILAYYWLGRLTNDGTEPKMPEVWMLTLLYDVANQAFGEDRQIWAVIGYLGFLLSGFVSMVWLIFTILEVMTIELGPKGGWELWQRTGIVCAVGFLVGVPALLPYELELVHILDHYVIGRIVIATVILELIAIAWIYGSGTVYIDFEFILGYHLNPYWKMIWWVAPLLLLVVEIWSLVSLPLTGIAETMPDPVWVFATGWTLYLSMWVIILITAIYQIARQIDYNLAGRLLSTLKPSRKWGPQDTMYRHNWHQWRKQIVDGERDYTLKRRGTKDYTHSLKRPLRQATAGNTIRSVKQPYSIQVPYNEADHVCWRGHNEHT